MKHKYLLLLLACTAGAAQAQRVNKPQMPHWARPERAHAHPQAHTAPGGQIRAAGDVVFSEDFANGMAGNNTFGAWTTNEADGELWRYTHSAPNGAYTDPSEIITSTTADNGWMLLATDSANTNWSDTTIVTSPVNFDAGLVSPTLDLSANPNVLVQFEMAGRWCCGDVPWYVQVSTDNGTSWSSGVKVLADQAINAGTGTVTASANISCDVLSGDATQVKFRFMHDGTNSGSSHYYWQIDDVKLVVAEDFDLVLQRASQSNWDLNTAFSYDSLNYTTYPYSQLRPIPLNMTVASNGSGLQNGTVLNFKVMEGTNTVLDQNQTVDLGACPETVFVSPDFTPPAVEGTYNVTYSATSSVGDVSTDDNSATSSFKVKEFIYARDGGTAADYEDIGDGEYELCNGFHITNEVELYAIDVAIRNGGTPSPVGVPIVGVLKDGSDVTIEITETTEHTIASNELNGTNGTKVISLIFSEPQLLEAGLDYFVCIKHFGGAEVRTAINGVAEDQTTFIYFEQTPGAGPDWFFTNDMPLVRMNFNSSVGIEEGDRMNGIGLGQNVPNPANGTTMIPFDLQQAANLTLEVHDMSGKLVSAQTIGKRAAGSHRLQYDTSALNEGVYFYSLVADGTRLTKRMTVIR